MKLAGDAEILYNKDNIPKNQPCAILILDSETGKHGAAVGCCVMNSAFLVIKFEETVMVFEEIVIKTTSYEYPNHTPISPI